MKCTPDNTQCPLHKELIASDARYQLRIKELEAVLAKRDEEGLDNGKCTPICVFHEGRTVNVMKKEIEELQAKLAALGEG